MGLVNDDNANRAAESTSDDHLDDGQGIENIGAQVRTSDLLICDVFDSGPVFGGDQDFTSQPFGDSLLTEGGSTHELSDAFCKGGLATRDLDRTLKRNNVRFLHEHPKYTTTVVHVNDYCCMPGNKLSCTVLLMPTRTHRGDIPQIVSTSPDGMTLGDRLKRCMAMKARKLGRHYTQNDLLADANIALGRPANAAPVITQQALSLILNNKRFESAATPAFAAALEVEALWLQFGVGPPSYLEALKAPV
jgi:hypothetical protein